MSHDLFGGFQGEKIPTPGSPGATVAADGARWLVHAADHQGVQVGGALTVGGAWIWWTEFTKWSLVVVHIYIKKKINE